MKRLIAGLALALALGSVAFWITAPNAGKLDVLLVAGQSNAVGFDALAKDLPANAADKDVLFWWRCGDPPPDEFDSTSGGQWSFLQPQPKGHPKETKEPRQYGNFHSADGGFGPEMGFARKVLATDHSKLAVVKAAFSGTGLRKDWNPNDLGASGSCYRALVSEVRSAVKAAEQKGLKPRLRALTWVQGESDANGNDVGHYEEALVAMMTALRKDLQAPDLIVLLAVNTRFGADKNASIPLIVEAQKGAAAKLGRSAYVDTAGATIANGAHFDSAGTLDVGERFADALKKVESAK